MRRLMQLWLPSTLAALAVLWLFYTAFYLYQIKDHRVWGLSDDAYVSACYARNLAHGAGCVWYPGAARVEGFSNPLWVFIMALMHRMPGFHEARLGGWIMALQSLLLASLFAIFWRCHRACADEPNPPPRDPWSVPPPALKCVMLMVLTLGAASLCFWMAEGFEVGLIALFALLAFERAAGTRVSAGDALIIGGLAGLAGWTRMDGPLYFAGAGMLLLGGASPWRRRLACAGLAAAVAAAMLGVGLLARHAYYGQWLPNTYYLKLEHWPLAERLRHGLRQNKPLLPGLGLAWLPLLAPGVRRRLGSVARPIGAALLVFTLAVLYSTHNGGDAWGLGLGYDRFAAIGGVFLILALALEVERLGWNRAALAVVFLYAAAVAALPLALDGGLPDVFMASLGLRKDGHLEKEWIGYGLALRKIAPEGARIALRPAGAIIYFSHRGGLDLLGKCEPWVAHQPVNLPDEPPGHNKDYGEGLMRLHPPEFSRMNPPEELERQYRAMRNKAGIFYVRSDVQNAHLEGLTPCSTLAQVVAHTIPGTLAPGQRATAEITMRNDGDAVWSDRNGFRLAVTRDPRGSCAAMAGRLGLEGATCVKRGESVTFHGELRAPETPGRCDLEFRMVQEHQHYFGQTLRVAVEVTSTIAK